MNNSSITTAADQLSTTLRGCSASEFTDAERDALGRCMLTLMHTVKPGSMSKLLENPEAGEIT